MAEQKEPFVVLPDAAEIMNRLKGVGGDAYMAETFYPLIAQAAGRELSAEGVALMFSSKIYDYVSSGDCPLIGVPDLIDALIDNKDIAENAKRFYQEAADAAKK